MYYLIENDYVGPNSNDERYWGAKGHYLAISEEPGRKNMSKEPCSDGWLGTTNDWSQHAHGEFETLAEAKAAAAELGFEVEIGSPDYAEPADWYYATPLDARCHVNAEGWYANVTPAELGITATTTDAELAEIINRERRANAADVSQDFPHGILCHGLDSLLIGWHIALIGD